MTSFFANHALVRKCLTKPIWWYETRRPYPIRSRIWQSEPHRVAETSPTSLTICATSRTITDAAWCARSFLQQLPSGLNVTVVADSFSAEARRKLESIFPGVQCFDDAQFMAEIAGIAPNVAKLGAYHPMGRKLAAILLLQRSHNLLFADSDVLCFNPIPEVTEAMGPSPNRGVHIEEELFTPIDRVTFRKIESLGYSYAPCFSCGFMYIPKGSLSLELANELLDTEATIVDWFPDTMVLGVLMKEAGAVGLPKDRYIQSNRRQFYFEEDFDFNHIRVRHYVGPVRHLMYKHGMPFLWRKWHSR